MSQPVPALTAWPSICSGRGNFKEAYQPVREEAVETIGATQFAMNQKWGTASAGLCRLLASTGRLSITSHLGGNPCTHHFIVTSHRRCAWRSKLSEWIAPVSR